MCYCRTMNRPKVVVLHTPLNDPAKLEQFVEECLREGVRLIAIHGKECNSVDGLIDDIVIGEGTTEDRFLVTSIHPDEPLDDVLNFAALWDGGSVV